MKNEMRTEQPDIAKMCCACMLYACVHENVFNGKIPTQCSFQILTKLSHEYFAPHGEVSV